MSGDINEITFTRAQVTALAAWLRRHPEACCVIVAEFLPDVHHVYLIHDHHVAPSFSGSLGSAGSVYEKKETQR